MGEKGECLRKEIDSEMGIVQQAGRPGCRGAQCDRDGEIRFGAIVGLVGVVAIDPEHRGLGEQGGAGS